MLHTASLQNGPVAMLETRETDIEEFDAVTSNPPSIARRCRSTSDVLEPTLNQTV
jgi:hypothetical protein